MLTGVIDPCKKEGTTHTGHEQSFMSTVLFLPGPVICLVTQVELVAVEQMCWSFKILLSLSKIKVSQLTGTTQWSNTSSTIKKYRSRETFPCGHSSLDFVSYHSH